MLAGIVVNNAIVLIDYINMLRRKYDTELREAVQEGGRRRLRPILMTTLTTCLALAPMAIGLGEGSEMQAPMARVVIGGLIVSTLITLVLIPTVYTIIEERRRRAIESAAA
jgi:HAE1 family hydrophobic/amphiphilic exporter-1